jgi:hypothetical protein
MLYDEYMMRIRFNRAQEQPKAVTHGPKFVRNWILMMLLPEEVQARWPLV